MPIWSPKRKLAVACLGPFVAGTPIILLAQWAGPLAWEPVRIGLLLAMIATGALILARLPTFGGERFALIVCYLLLMPILMVFYILALLDIFFGLYF